MQKHNVQEQKSTQYQTKPLLDVASDFDKLLNIATILQTRCLQGWQRIANRGSIRWEKKSKGNSFSVVLFVESNGQLAKHVGCYFEDPPLFALGIELTDLKSVWRERIRQQLQHVFDELYLHPAHEPGKQHLAPNKIQNRYDIVLLPREPDWVAERLNEFMDRLHKSARRAYGLNGVDLPPSQLIPALSNIRDQIRWDIMAPYRVKFREKNPRCKLESLLPRCANTKVNTTIKQKLIIRPTLEKDWRCNCKSADFHLNSRGLNVNCNVFEIPPDDIALLQAEKLENHLGMAGIARKAREYLKAAEDHIEENCPEECPCRTITDMMDSHIEDLILKEPQTTGELAKWLKRWDGMSRELESCVENHCESKCPIHVFIRQGLFNPEKKQVNGKVFPPGCYVSEEADDKEATTYHELAHAAMAVHRENGAIEGCRWLEEGFAEFLMGTELGMDRCRENWSELDVYMSWKYIDSLSTQKAEELLQKWLASAQPEAFCDEVRALRNHIGVFPCP